MQDAAAVAHEVGRAIAAMGVPVFFYGAASSPPGRALSELRRGGFEALLGGFTEGREPDLPASSTSLHPKAGATCVGARNILLAWNVFVDGITHDAAKAIAAQIRERDGGFSGVRALGLYLDGQRRVQISMNLEDPERTPPIVVFEAIERAVLAQGGSMREIEVIGMMPDPLVHPAVVDRLHLPDPNPALILSRRVAEHVQKRLGAEPLTPDDPI